MYPTLYQDITPAWFSYDEDGDVPIISTRIRLARNIHGNAFPSKASLDQKSRVFLEVSEKLSSLDSYADFFHVNFSQIQSVDQNILFEKRVASRELIAKEGDRGIIFDDQCRLSIMVNEEDHIRLQCTDAGYCPDSAWKAINLLDDKLGRLVDYAFDSKRGFLTTCPTNAGTGLRISFLMHLPALVLTQEIDKILNGVSHMGIASRGFFGEDSDVVGNFFQLSNQATMGASENEFIQSTTEIIRDIIAYEQEARCNIVSDAAIELHDKIYRSYGILSNARTLTIDELLNLSSSLRLGIELGILENWTTIKQINLLILKCMPAHMEHLYSKELDEHQESVMRAELVRKELPQLS